MYQYTWINLDLSAVNQSGLKNELFSEPELQGISVATLVGYYYTCISMTS